MVLRKWKRYIFGISPRQASFAQRGFSAVDVHARTRLERVGETFIHGYTASLDDAGTQALAEVLAQVDPEMRGFAFEGAAMGLALLDLTSLWRHDRVDGFLTGPARQHPYMTHVGIGWALARLRKRLRGYFRRLDPLLRWLSVDGYGFHEGYFHPAQAIRAGRIPGRLKGYARRAFDQGLGRSLWFVLGADIERIATTIKHLDQRRHGDLYSGVGLAATYAAGGPGGGLETLLATAGPHLGALAQGAAFAAKTRERAGNPAEHTELACRALCGISAGDAAAVTDHALEGLPDDVDGEAYEMWRQRIQDHFQRTLS